MLRHSLYILTIALLACSCSKSDSDEPDVPGKDEPAVTVPQDKVLADQIVASSAIGTPMAYTIYLPYDYDPKTPTPVLYLLHGADGDNNDWTVKGGFDRCMSDSKASFAVVMPNCTLNGKNLFYIDNYQGNYKYMTYFFSELLPHVEKTYNLGGSRELRAVAGLSMGGYGSLYYGSLHPEMFACVYACSPATSIDGTPNLMSLWLTASKGKTALPDLTIEIGTSDFLYYSANSFHEFLLKYEIDHEYITREGAHDWPFWQVCAPKIVKKCSEIFK